jgi:hypothetical protein
MMYEFISHNRDQLIARCRSKVAMRPHRGASPLQLGSGVPLFLDQLQHTLEAEEGNDAIESVRISGASGGDALAVS